MPVKQRSHRLHKNPDTLDTEVVHKKKAPLGGFTYLSLQGQLLSMRQRLKIQLFIIMLFRVAQELRKLYTINKFRYNLTRFHYLVDD